MYICFLSLDFLLQDAFLWTAVMCASWSGQRAAVRLLLRHGAAWVGVVDTQGRDAQELAAEGIIIHPYQLRTCMSLPLKLNLAFFSLLSFSLFFFFFLNNSRPH